MGKLSRDQIAWRIAQDLKEGWFVNLGVGIPLKVSAYIPANLDVLFHSENGIIGVGPSPKPGEEDPEIINAGKGYATLVPGASFFDSSLSFSIVRGKHLDVAIVGAFQVSRSGDLANWKVPGHKWGGIGGAADLSVGTKRLWIAMAHTTEDGSPKIVEKCAFPLTGIGVVSRIYTDLAVIEVDRQNGGLTLVEVAPGITPEYVSSQTGAELKMRNKVREMDLKEIH
ncbi:MAG: 3-oxoacid CoA-transferase subunit B [Nitrososphaerales archaeon]